MLPQKSFSTLRKIRIYPQRNKGHWTAPNLDRKIFSFYYKPPFFREKNRESECTTSIVTHNLYFGATAVCSSFACHWVSFLSFIKFFSFINNYFVIFPTNEITTFLKILTTLKNTMLQKYRRRNNSLSDWLTLRLYTVKLYLCLWNSLTIERT